MRGTGCVNRARPGLWGTGIGNDPVYPAPTERDGLDVPFEALSGGEKAFFLLAIDLARRLLLAFPGSSVAESPGLVCIDEIELHLHPAWQRQILVRLIELFPCCQFVVSTHSPQVIGSVAARHVRILESNGDGHIEVTSPIASKGRDSNYLLEGILGTPVQNPGVDELFAKFDQLVDAGKHQDAGDILDELDELIEGSSSRVAVRREKVQAAAKRIGVKGPPKRDKPEVQSSLEESHRA